MAKWDFKIVGASFVKELVPIADDVQPRSQSFMQPSFHLEGGKIVMKESGQYVTAIYFPQIGEIGGVAPTDIEDALAKLLTLVENFNGGEGTPQNLAQTLAIDNKTNDIPIVSNNGNGYAYVNDEQTVIGNDFGGTKKITMNEDSFAIETNVRATIDGKGLELGTTTDGFLMPRVTTYQMNAIDALLLSESLLVYNTTESKFYQYNGTEWVVFGPEYEISTAKIINRCPDDAFRNAHGNLSIGNSWYLGTRGDFVTAPSIIYFPDIRDLQTFQKVTLPSTSFGGMEYLAYNETLGKIYSCLNTDKIIVFNDITDVSDYDIIDLTLSVGEVDTGSVIMTDDTYIYIGTRESPSSHFIKLDASDYSEVTIVEWTGRPNIHSATWNADKSLLRFCQNGTICYRALINPVDMTFTEKFVGDSITDDIVFCVGIFSNGFFDAVFYPSESRFLGTKGGYLENPDTEEIYAVDVMPSITAYWDDVNLELTLGTIDGSIEVFSGEMLTASAMGYVNPNKASEVYVNGVGNKFNETTKVDGRLFASIWNNDTIFGEDGLGACVEIELIKVKNGAIGKVEKNYRTDFYFKRQIQQSVTAVSFIDIDFYQGEWNSLLNKDYGINLSPNNSASALALSGSWVSNKGTNSFRLNFTSPVTASLNYTLIINP